MASVELKHLRKVFQGGVIAIDDLNLSIEHGEFVVLLGPSGCGKTTTLQIIAGLELQSSGSVLFDNVSVDNLPTHRRDIAMVFQSYALYPHKRVYDNMAFGLRMRGTPKPEIDRQVRHAAEILGIKELLGRRPSQLSGGQRQRVALGRAIVRQPRVFLLDEPLSNIDAKLRSHMRLELKALHRDLRATFIYVTHDQVEAMSMGDRIAVMHDGVLQQYDKPAVIYARPANLFVATFIGSPAMNLFEGRLTDGGARFDGGAFDYRWAGSARHPVGDGAEVALGIRPNDVKVSKETLNGQSIRAPVEFQEPLGSDLFLTLRVGDAFLVARTDPDFQVETGESVAITFPESRVHLFDRVTGNRVENVEGVAQ